MAPKPVALVGAACLTAGWLLASMLTPPVARLQSLPDRRSDRVAPPSAEEPPAAFAELLQSRLQKAPTAPTPRRNPFVFAARDRRGTPETARPAAEPDVAPPPLAPQVQTPPFTLSGVGVSSTSDGEVRTAVLSDGAQVHLVKTGDTLRGYSVVDVTDTAATLVDAAGMRFVLRLR